MAIKTDTSPDSGSAQGCCGSGAKETKTAAPGAAQPAVVTSPASIHDAAAPKKSGSCCGGGAGSEHR